MRNLQKMLLAALVMLVLAGCASAPAEEKQATVDQTEPIPTQTQPAETKPEELPTDPLEEDAPTSLLKFYFGQQEICAGAPVADVLELGIKSFFDFSCTLEPGHISNIIRVDIPEEEGKERTVFYFRAINPAGEIQQIKDCIIYSVTINGGEGIAFGYGTENEAFINLRTTEEELYNAFGTPDFSRSLDETYREIAYYEPFNSIWFSFEKGVVRQVTSCYNAQLQNSLEEPLELTGYFGNDALVLMSRHMDVAPYLTGEPLPQGTGVLSGIEEIITIGEDQIQLGCFVHEMPQWLSEPYEKAPMSLGSNYYVRIGIGNPEEFFIINRQGLPDGTAYYAQVKGIITCNRGYTNWGSDFSDYHEFEYCGIKSDSTIDDVIAVFGAPAQLYCDSSANISSAWMHYLDDAGNELRICVDPMVNQIVEIRVIKYFEEERAY